MIKDLGLLPRCHICGKRKTPDYADMTGVNMLGRVRQILGYSCKENHDGEEGGVPTAAEHQEGTEEAVRR